MERDTILIVDDSQVNRVILRKLLETEYKIVEAGDGTAGLSLLEKLSSRLCLLILDIWMPMLDGIGVLAAMRAKGWLSAVPVIVVTSDATAELEARLLTFGVQYVIPKPFDPPTVKSCVHDAIANHGANSAGHMLIVEADRQKNLLKRINTFLYEYDYADDVSHIDARYMKCLRGNWHAFRLDAPERVRECIYRPDYERFVTFLKHECGINYDTLDLRMLTVSGGYEWFRIGMLQYEDERGAHTVLTFTNVSNEMHARERLDFLARNDSLTQIPNLQAFFDNTRQMLLAHPDEPFVMLRMGVERFSIFNQLYGRTEGDRLLRYVAVKLQEGVEAGEEGTYCRIRSDDFAACIPDREGYADELIESLQTALQAYPVNFEVALCFGRFAVNDKHAPVDDMLERAATAQRTVKGNYNRHIAAYDAALRKQDETERMILLDMHEALKSEQFAMFLQPKCDMHTGRIVGSEALVRWLHPEHGMISPGVFIPLFERSGFIAELDRFIIKEACRTLRKWIDSGVPALPISVNVSRADLYNPHLIDDILGLVARYRIPHELLGFELTESSFVVDNSMVSGLTELLKKNGFCVLMDDFGSGYSSLNTLKDIYVNVLKIDLRFLQSSDDVVRANRILYSVCKMAQDIGLDIVVEGVETQDQAELLKSIGVRFAQGFYYYRPMPVQECERLLQNERAVPRVK